MEDQKPGIPDFFTSVKRIEFLLEEILFRQIAYNSLSEPDANETFKAALKNVKASMENSLGSSSE